MKDMNGLIDASRLYSGRKDVVESIGKGEEKSPDKNEQVVVNYLTHLGNTLLNFIVLTHAHSDHIDGMP